MTASAQYRYLFKHSTIRLLQATHGRHCRPFRSPEPSFQGLDATYTATTISPLPVTKHMTGCRHVQKLHDVVLHIPPSSSSNTSVKLLMIELTEQHLLIHMLLAPIRRSTDPQAYVHNPNMIEYDWADGTPSDDSYIACTYTPINRSTGVCTQPKYLPDLLKSNYCVLIIFHGCTPNLSTLISTRRLHGGETMARPGSISNSTGITTSKALISASRRQAGTTMRRLMPNLSVGYPLPSTEQRISTWKPYSWSFNILVLWYGDHPFASEC